MSKSILRFVLGSMLLLAAACAPGQPLPDLNTVNTVVAQTLAALSSPTPDAGTPVTDVGSPTATITAIAAQESPTALVTTAIVPESPTATATIAIAGASPTFTSLAPTGTMTPIVLFTATPIPAGAVQVQVSVPTNCRTGPGRAFTRVGGLQLGQVAEVVGRNAASTYWVIRNPDRPGDTCWLWGEYATVTGDTSALTVYTPPPTPTLAPGVDVGFARLESCAGTGWWVDLELENNGGLTFNSMVLTVRDTINDASVTLYTDDFTDRFNCTDTETHDTLPAGGERLVSSPYFTSDPRGHAMRATVTLCSNTGQSGTCVTKTINFTP